VINALITTWFTCQRVKPVQRFIV